jgi:hypothetical protein
MATPAIIASWTRRALPLWAPTVASTPRVVGPGGQQALDAGRGVVAHPHQRVGHQEPGQEHAAGEHHHHVHEGRQATGDPAARRDGRDQRAQSQHRAEPDAKRRQERPRMPRQRDIEYQPGRDDDQSARHDARGQSHEELGQQELDRVYGSGGQPAQHTVLAIGGEDARDVLQRDDADAQYQSRRRPQLDEPGPVVLLGGRPQRGNGTQGQQDEGR